MRRTSRKFSADWACWLVASAACMGSACSTPQASETGSIVAQGSAGAAGADGSAASGTGDGPASAGTGSPVDQPDDDSVNPADASAADSDASSANAIDDDPNLPPLSRVHLGEDATGAHVEQDGGPVVRFIAVGDTGTGDDNQKRIADAMQKKCKAEGCDFILMLGDNIYEGGPTSVDDPQWKTKLEDIYAPLQLPIYPVLGNHDVGTFIGSGYNPAAVPTEVGYTMRSQIWKMPAAHYTVSIGDVGIVMFDTTALYNHVVEQGDQHAWIDAARDALSKKHRWVFAAAHHTYVSNGEHGNAGAYAYLDFDLGAEVKQFVEQDICGQVDVLFTGHDHNRQWLDSSLCAGTEVVVSGAGAKTRPLVGKNPNLYQSDTLGFFYVVVDGSTLTGQFIDDQGNVSFERTLQK